ncbi:MAG: RagB/SusD family nutrient uptake outer membrane protein [Bacteroidota bacterium]
MKKLLLTLSALVVFAVSCSEDVFNVPNENAYSDATYFASAAQFNEALTATYSTLLHTGMYSRDWYFTFDLLGNDAERDAPLLGDLAELHNFSYNSANPILYNLWRSLYRVVLRANLVITRAGEWEPELDSDAVQRDRFIAEASFLKAFAEGYLVANWGRVPLYPTYDDHFLAEVPRASSIEEAWSAAEASLLRAIDGLPETAEAGRATKGAAIALLGRFYMYQGKYNEAITQLEKLTQAPYSYALLDNFDDLFAPTTGANSESIFFIPHGEWQGWGVGNAFYMFGGQETWGGRATHTGRAMEYGWNDWRNVKVNASLVDAYTYADESGADYTDPRAALTFYGDVDSGGDTDFCHGCEGTVIDPAPAYFVADADGVGPYMYPFGENDNGYRWRKYNLYEYEEKHSLPQSPINSQVIRYADVLLMLAEAYIETGSTGQALDLINAVRARSGAFEYGSLGDQSSAREIVRRERRLELAGEQLRWFDLNRWGVAKEVINAEKQRELGNQPFEDKHELLPIPQREKDLNPGVAGDVANDWN